MALPGSCRPDRPGSPQLPGHHQRAHGPHHHRGQPQKQLLRLLHPVPRGHQQDHQEQLPLQQEQPRIPQAHQRVRAVLRQDQRRPLCEDRADQFGQDHFSAQTQEVEARSESGAEISGAQRVPAGDSRREEGVGPRVEEIPQGVLEGSGRHRVRGSAAPELGAEHRKPVDAEDQAAPALRPEQADADGAEEPAAPEHRQRERPGFGGVFIRE